MIRRRTLIFLLALGTLTGYASGFASLHRWHHSGHGGYCHSGQAYGDDYNPGPPAPAWAPPQAPAQAPTPEPR
jgi:hypothetical protein